MTTTKEFAIAHKLCGEEVVPAIADAEFDEPLPGTASEIARRAIILHGVVAVGFGVDGGEVLRWLDSQGLTDEISPQELALLQAEEPSEQDSAAARWRVEAEWALLWAIGKVRTLGLPTRTCDTTQLVDEIMPGLGTPIDKFVESAQLRSPGEILAESDRHYHLHCYIRQAMKRQRAPRDLQYVVLWQRCYAFEWLYNSVEWDEVQVDA
ncbi:DUF4272 domain-containing protein [Blastopirellula sp. JC732]|uniref:DUF4272 domain-containing protein n=1 Tax=Blastopirellula sediminis TaxID=2894196 RepID=A0A9X1SHH8_9BACT|nr:DUF4272 domain-containing protein [Blastopirellula sediminis]MCC9606269.1 DUF4272 domain-containing protein [Blastopirellula sediminis]MCC9630433.1 DUF4272 domain-containing protein [Blastopirellula sediminis]